MDTGTTLSEGVFELFLNGYSNAKIYSQDLLNAWATFRITIGNLLIRGYRIFKRLKNHRCIIFYKKGHQTKYLYMKIATKFEYPLENTFFTGINLSIAQLNRLKKNKTPNYSVLICYSLQKSALEIKSCKSLQQKILSNPTGQALTLQSILSHLSSQQFPEEIHLVSKFAPEQEEERQLQQDSESEFKKLKDILYHYIDTFAQKYKTNYYKDLEKQCLTSYNITNLINTLNIIIYEESRVSKKTGYVEPMYSQIQSCVWTAFNKNKNELESDRKDIVLSGNGRVLIIDLLFMRDLKKYVNCEEYLGEVKEVLEEFRKSHTECKLKVIKVTNQLNKKTGFELSYYYESSEPEGFNKRYNSNPI